MDAPASTIMIAGTEVALHRAIRDGVLAEAQELYAA